MSGSPAIFSRSRGYWARPGNWCRGECCLQQLLVMAGGAAAVDSGIEADRGLQAFVAEKLADGFVVAVLDLKNGFRAQVPELMRCQLEPGPLTQIGLDQHRDHRLAFRPAIGVHKNPLRPS